MKRRENLKKWEKIINKDRKEKERKSAWKNGRERELRRRRKKKKKRIAGTRKR